MLKFYYGTAAQYATATKDSDALYFITDQKKSTRVLLTTQRLLALLLQCPLLLLRVSFTLISQIAR